MLTINGARAHSVRTIQHIIDGYGPAFRGWLNHSNARIVVLSEGQRYRDVSRELRRRGTVDDFPIPPAGLFVVAENTVYLRVLSRMTITHELVHAYDRARGEGQYRSRTDATVRELFQRARAFVTPYAASGLDEYFAECGRCLHPAPNDPGCPWPSVSSERLREVDPGMWEYLTALFAQAPPTALAA